MITTFVFTTSHLSTITFLHLYRNILIHISIIQDAHLIFAETLINRGVGFVAETGLFTTHCPGLYQFSFAGYGSDDLKLTLKKKANKSENWRPITSAGPGGGANLILLDAEVGDQFAVFVEAGKAKEGITYTGNRVAKK